MKKIGILSFGRTNNYGAVLQNYALVKTLQNMNVEVNTINYKSDFLEKPYQKNPYEIKTNNIIKKIYYSICKKYIQKKFLIHNSKFNAFREKYLALSDEVNNKDDILLKSYFDIIIAGSDQVWNDNITNNDPIFSLGFETKSLKVSYAASAGNNEYIGIQTMNNIKNIDLVSVRENNLLNLLLKNEIKAVEVVDPVFLLSYKEWNMLLPKENICKEKFIFTYSVSEKTDDVIKISKHFAKQLNCHIKHADLSTKYGIKSKTTYSSGPLEFLQYIRDAELVIASSFHAVAFSIIFNKKFIVIPTEKTQSRINNLLEITDMQKQSVSSYSEFLTKDIKFSKLTNKECLYQKIEKSKKFLKKTIIVEK